jgi:hypothetical protein
MRKGLLLIFLGFAALFEGCKKEVSVPIDSGVFAKCRGDSFRIDLLDTVKTLPDSAVDQQMDQLRDWVWTTLLARVSAQTSQPELLAGISRQPLVRNDSLSHLLEQPVGRARSTVGKDGTIYVLVQRSDPRRVMADVLEAVDQESFFLGEGPKAVEVYGVDFKMETAEAQVCKLASVDKAWVEGPGSGFRESHVKSTEDLAAFLDGGADLLSASCSIDDKDEPVLDLTGRQRPRTTRAPMTVAHVAALNREIQYVPTDGLPAAKLLPDKVKEQAREVGEEIDSAWTEAQSAGVIPQLKGEDSSTQQILDRVLSWKSENPQVAAAELLMSYQAQGMGNLGFSLDPKTDLSQALKNLDELAAALQQNTRLLPLLRQWGMSPDQALALVDSIVTDGSSLRDTRTKVDELRGKLEALDAFEATRTLLETAKSSRSISIRQALHSAQYQSARYDGPLQGTEPAMTMFYTDLLAKLWALDWRQCSPTGIVPGFVSVIDQRNSPAFCQEDQGIENTRIWFGSRQEAYAHDEATALRLAPNATRLYALGSALGSEFSEEVEPAANMQRFIGWWDRHYEDVADWEPQYELLNQLVKWTLVRRMADASPSSHCLAFLDHYELGPPKRFDRWVKAKKDLRWGGPVPLLDGTETGTERLPLFTSEFFELCRSLGWLSGGVTLPQLSDFADLPVRQADPLPYLRRQDSVRPAEPLPAGGGHYASLQLPRGKIEDYNVVVASDGVRSEGRLISAIMVRDNSGFRPKEAGPITRRKDFLLSQGGNKAEAHEVRDGFGVGRFLVSELKSSAPQVKFLPGAEIRAKRLGLEVSAHLQSHGGDLKSAAKETAGGVPVMVLSDGRVAVGPLPEVEGEKTYAVLSSGGGERGPPPAGDRYEVGASDSGDGGGGSGNDGSGFDGTGGKKGSVGIILVADKDAKPYFKRRGAVEVPESNPIAREVREYLDKGDLEGAEKAAASDDAPPRVLTAIAAEAARRKRIEVVEEMTNRLVLHPEAVWEIRRTSKEVEVLRASLARGGKTNENACRRLASCLLRLAIVANRLPPRDAARELARLGDQAPPAFYALSLPKFAYHPPIGYGPGHPAKPRQQEVLELVNSAHRLADLPAQIRVGESDFKLVQGPAPQLGVERQRISPWGEASEKLPLLSMLAEPGTNYVWPLPVVVRCIDRASGQVATGASRWLPDCERPTGYGLTSAEAKEKAWKIAADLLACDLDGDGRVSGSRERSCVDNIMKENEVIFRSSRQQ